VRTGLRECARALCLHCVVVYSVCSCSRARRASARLPPMRACRSHFSVWWRLCGETSLVRTVCVCCVRSICMGVRVWYAVYTVTALTHNTCAQPRVPTLTCFSSRCSINRTLCCWVSVYCAVYECAVCGAHRAEVHVPSHRLVNVIALSRHTERRRAAERARAQVCGRAR
jgi:hypothetical protein